MPGRIDIRRVNIAVIKNRGIGRESYPTESVNPKLCRGDFFPGKNHPGFL